MRRRPSGFLRLMSWGLRYSSLIGPPKRTETRLNRRREPWIGYATVAPGSFTAFSRCDVNLDALACAPTNPSASIETACPVVPPTKERDGESGWWRAYERSGPRRGHNDD